MRIMLFNLLSLHSTMNTFFSEANVVKSINQGRAPELPMRKRRKALPSTMEGAVMKTSHFGI